MKTILKLSLLTTGLLAASFCAAATTDTAPAATAPSAPAAAPARPHHGHPLRQMMIRHQVAKKLGLSADQIAQLKTLRQSTASTVKGIRADTTLTPDQKKAKIRETLTAARTQMHNVLTPDQQAQLKTLRSHHRRHPNA